MTCIVCGKGRVEGSDRCRLCIELGIMARDPRGQLLIDPVAMKTTALSVPKEELEARCAEYMQHIHDARAYWERKQGS